MLHIQLNMKQGSLFSSKKAEATFRYIQLHYIELYWKRNKKYKGKTNSITAMLSGMKLLPCMVGTITELLQ